MFTNDYERRTMDERRTIQENNPTKYGENGHLEYCWSDHIQEYILQFYFQLTRCEDENGLHKLENHLINILTFIKEKLETMDNRIDNKMGDKEVYIVYLSYLYCMVGQTRDIIEGKGEYTLTYMMIYTWYRFYPQFAFFILKTLVQSENKEHPYGSWKDMKYFYKYCKKKGLSDNDPLIQTMVEIINNQLMEDATNFNSYSKNTETNPNINISLVSKWIPRENSTKWGNLYNLLACHYFSYYIRTGKDYDSKNQITYSREIKAILKCKIQYRKIISMLNKHLNTVEVKMCAKEWKTIDFHKEVTSIGLFKNKKAFLNVKKNGDIRYSNNEDRITCALNFKSFMNDAITSNHEIKGKRIGLNDFIKEAIELIKKRKNKKDLSEELQKQIDLLNIQWKNNSNQTETIKKMVPIIDVSKSMEGNPLYAAIGLGIQMAEKSLFGNRIMTFGSSANWINLENKETFLDKVDCIQQVESGTNKNFYQALDKILDAIIETKLSPEEVKDMVLVILSDMQIEPIQSSLNNNNVNKYSFYDEIREKYKETGIRLYGKALQLPHLLFWNLKSTDGFPNLFNEGNTSMETGFNPSLLKSFSQHKYGCANLHLITPLSHMIKTLEKERYKILSNHIKLNILKKF